jgi:hypothetical protein
MLILSGTTHQVRLTLALATTTNAVEIVFSYVDVTTTSATPTGSSTTKTTTTAADMLGSPAASTQRVVKYLSLCNTDTASCTGTFSHYDGTNARRLWRGVLAANESVVYTEAAGWVVFNASGVPKLTTS